MSHRTNRRAMRALHARVDAVPKDSLPPEFRDDVLTVRELGLAFLDGKVDLLNGRIAGLDRTPDPQRHGLSEAASVYGQLFAMMTATMEILTEQDPRTAFLRGINGSLGT